MDVVFNFLSALVGVLVGWKLDQWSKPKDPRLGRLRVLKTDSHTWKIERFQHHGFLKNPKWVTIHSCHSEVDALTASITFRDSEAVDEVRKSPL